MGNIVFAISGKMLSGKDTVALMIAEKLKDNAAIVFKQSFAHKLKQIVSTITDVPMSEVETPFDNVIVDFTRDQKNMYLPIWGMTLGEMLQKIGTEGMRDGFDQDVWVKALMESLDFDVEDDKLPIVNIITDMRLQNEADYLKKFDNAVLIRVNRDVDRSHLNRDQNHKSEIDLDEYDGFDYVFNNNGSLDDLSKLVDEVLVGYELIRV